MRFKLPIVLFALFALTAAACSSSETADEASSSTTVEDRQIIDIDAPATTTTTTLDPRICENDGSPDWSEKCLDRQKENYSEEELEEVLRNISSDGSDEIIRHVSSGDICDDYLSPAPHRAAGQPTDLDEDGVPYGTKIRTSYLPHSQPDTFTEFEGSQFIYAPWKEYEGRKVWESYPLDIDLYNFYSLDLFTRSILGDLVIEADELIARKAEYQRIGCLYHQVVEEIWDTADIYTPEAQARIDAGETVYRYNEIGNGIVDIIDPSAGFPLVVQFDDNELPKGQYYNVCPPRPRSSEAREVSRYALRGVDPELIRVAQRLVELIPPDDSLEMEWFISGITTPEGRQIYQESELGQFSRLRALLSLSPGEPSDTTVHSLKTNYYPSLILDGYFPGDWSAESMEVINRHLAAVAVHNVNSFYSVSSASDASIFERCTDIESTLGRASDRQVSEIGTLEQNLSKGLDTIALGEPVSEVYVAYHTSTLSFTIICNSAHTLHFKDSFTGDKVPTRTRSEMPAGVLAHVYGSSNEGQYSFLGLVSERAGKCKNADGSLTQTFNDVLADIRQYLDDNSFPEWGRVPIHQWHSISQAEAWESQRDPSYINNLLCESGIPYGEIIDNRLTRPNQLSCTDEQWQTMEQAALNARKRTDFLVGQYIGQLSSNTNIVADETKEWYERNHNTWLGQWLTEYIPTEEYIGCGDRLSDFLSKPYSVNDMGDVSKKPWVEGALPGTNIEDEWGYPNPFSPCPGWEPPPFEDEKYWWPLP